MPNTTTGRAVKDAAAASILADVRQYAALDTSRLRRMMRDNRAAIRRAAVLAARIAAQEPREEESRRAAFADAPDDLKLFLHFDESPEMRGLKQRHAATVARLRNLNAGFALMANGDPCAALDAWTALKREYHRRADYLKHVAPFDAQNAGAWVIAPSLPRPEYSPDTTQYAALNRQARYVDISPRQVLKLLFQEHKITKRDYKDALRREDAHKRQRPTIAANVTRYYGSMKATTGKWGRASLRRLTEPSRPVVFMSENGSRYRVVLKRRFASRIGEPLPVTHDAPGLLALSSFALLFGQDVREARTAHNHAIRCFCFEDATATQERKRAHKAATLTEYAHDEFKTRLRNCNQLIGIEDAPEQRD